VNLKQLNYFVKIVEAQNMTRAAEGLHIAQPALSQQIALLEEELGVALLTRSARGIQATPQGDLLYRHAKSILRQVDNTRILLTKNEGDVTGNVSVGMPSSTAKLLALRLMRCVKERYPSIVLELVDVPSADLIALVRHGRVDFSLIPDPQKPKDIRFAPLFCEELYLMTYPGAITGTKAVSFKKISEFPLILPSAPNTLRSRLEHAFLKAHLNLNLFGEASTSAILIPAVRAGLAATVLPYSAAHEEILNRQIEMHSIGTGFARDVYLCSSNTLSVSPATSTVIALCKEVVEDLVKRGTWKGCRLLR
jgi:LysR family nitrogen assimilation transcriptional regulator